MEKKTLNRFAKTIIKALPLRLVPLDLALRGVQWVGAVLAQGLFFRDWRLETFGRPQFFKHQVNLNRWISEPWQGGPWPGPG